MCNIAEAKKELREKMRRLRADKAASNPDAHRKLYDVFVRHISLPEHSVVSGYSAFGEEMNQALLLDLLRGQGHIIALPRIVGKGLPLSFHRYEPGDEVAVSSMGIAEPLAASQVVVPNVMLVPLLAFDAARNRLGYGGGFYDRTITLIAAQKPVLTIGVGYDYQQVPEIPVEPHDRRLDKIVTDLKAF